MQEEQKSDLIFAKGIQFYSPRENAPKTIKGNLVIQLDELLAFANEHGIEKTLRIDVRKSTTKGTIYLTLNTWKPTQEVKEPKKDDGIDF